ncbi:MAG: aminotransferase class V-fold PLP-dependent enzyme [Phycisphaerae bacterium]|nr:aminotransferase class V-fold PLP-dependent enzyme [Phycisphaerae bacterium]
MPNRRSFLGHAGATAAALGVIGAGRAFAAGVRPTPAWRPPSRAGTPEEVARDEGYWTAVARAYTVDRSILNLNNGGVSPAPWPVQDAMRRHLEYSNSCPPPVSLWRVLEPQREAVRQAVARQWGVDAEEIAFTRNASESLQICQLGLGLRPGDEVLTTTQDYPRMITTFKQRARREGVVLKQFSIPTPCEDDDEIVRRFEAAMTERTRLMLMSHVTFTTGQVLPVKKVAALARSRGVPLIVDGAHALAQLDYTIAELECDYYGVSLHKWLGAPHGTGLLYVRRDRIAGLWPMMAATEERNADIRKFEEIGTHPAANTLAVAEALAFHQAIGAKRREARLRYLKETWARRLLRDERVRLHTSLDPRYSGAIGTFEIRGLDPAKLDSHLWEKHRILVTGIAHEEFRGTRVTPNVYTSLEELERFCEAVERVIRDGLPA